MKHIFKVLLIAVAMASAVFAWEDTALASKSTSKLLWTQSLVGTGTSVSNDNILLLTASSVGACPYSFKITTAALAATEFDVRVFYGMAFTNTNANVYTNLSASGTNMYGTRPDAGGTSPARVFHIVNALPTAGSGAFSHVSTAATLLRTERFLVVSGFPQKWTLSSPLVLDPNKYYFIQISNRTAASTNLNYIVEIQAEKLK